MKKSNNDPNIGKQGHLNEKSHRYREGVRTAKALEWVREKRATGSTSVKRVPTSLPTGLRIMKKTQREGRSSKVVQPAVSV